MNQKSDKHFVLFVVEAWLIYMPPFSYWHLCTAIAYFLSPEGSISLHVHHFSDFSSSCFIYHLFSLHIMSFFNDLFILFLLVVSFIFHYMLWNLNYCFHWMLEECRSIYIYINILSVFCYSGYSSLNAWSKFLALNSYLIQNWNILIPQYKNCVLMCVQCWYLSIYHKKKYIKYYEWIISFCDEREGCQVYKWFSYIFLNFIDW